jgi:acyl carrier protein
MVTENKSVEEALQKIVARIIRKEDVKISRDTTFKELGADSLDIVQIMVALEEEYDIELVDEELKAITDMGSFLDYVQKKVDAKK